MVFRQAPVELPGLAPMPGQPFGVYLHVPFCLTLAGTRYAMIWHGISAGTS
ncbi:oxygen-independent coproporphyrinogen III oxidase HemN domain protein [Mycobacterium tuberculosis variant bovis]|nr:oxygen-independent coproporphyrinogen III oxidase HemN domain protein [Mycobacterium tuberculosis variant bovis]KAF3411248.1 oxygen-independent coproporphyrinogen III oxidase HemN domain protein [Mycobacterium tuberculosis variant bovis]